jgi:hypothetical protein
MMKDLKPTLAAITSETVPEIDDPIRPAFSYGKTVKSSKKYPPDSVKTQKSKLNYRGHDYQKPLLLSGTMTNPPSKKNSARSKTSQEKE